MLTEIGCQNKRYVDKKHLWVPLMAKLKVLLNLINHIRQYSTATAQQFRSNFLVCEHIPYD